MEDLSVRERSIEVSGEGMMSLRAVINHRQAASTHYEYHGTQ